MVHIIPYLNYEIKSLEKKDVILERFCQSINLESDLLLNKASLGEGFEGILLKDGFTLRRILKFGYSPFLPILSCEIQEVGKDVCLKVNIQFHKFSNIFLTLYFLSGVLFLIHTINFNSGAMTLGIYIFILYLFNREIKYVINEFNKITFSNDPVIK
jgi:hypothetical protein